MVAPPRLGFDDQVHGGAVRMREADFEQLARRMAGRGDAAAADAVRAALAASLDRIEHDCAAIARRAEEPLRRLAGEPVDAARPIADAELAIALAETREADRLVDARATVARRERDLDRFKERHRLDRDADYPESAVLAAALLVAAAALEALFSAALLERSQDHGFLGAGMIAVGLSGGNVALGFLAGYLGMRYVQHAQWPQRIAGAAIGLAALGGAVALNVYTALFRDQAGQTERLIDAQREAERLYDRQIALPTQETANFFGLFLPVAPTLLMIALGAFVFAALKGYSGVDDPYPDYGKRARALAKARAEAEGRLAAAKSAMNEAIEAARKSLNQRLDERRAALALGRGAFDAAEAEAHALRRQGRQTVRRANAALARLGSTPEPEPGDDPMAVAGDLLHRAQARLTAAEDEAAAGLARLHANVQTARERLAGNAP